MRYSGVVPLGPSHLQLVVVEELRDPDPPIRLVASFFEPGSADEVASQLRLWEGEVVVALGGPSDPEAGERSCDAMLAGLGVAPTRASPELAAAGGAARCLGPLHRRGRGRRHGGGRGLHRRAADRDQRRRRVLRAAEPATAGPPPPARYPDAHRRAGGRGGHRRRRRPVAPAHRGARGRCRRAVRSPLRGRSRLLAGRARMASSSCPARPRRRASRPAAWCRRSSACRWPAPSRPPRRSSA